MNIYLVENKDQTQAVLLTNTDSKRARNAAAHCAQGNLDMLDSKKSTIKNLGKANNKKLAHIILTIG